MKPARYLHFSAFRLDRVEEQLWQGTQLLPLRRKPFALLRYLVEHAGEVVTKDTLLDALWPNVHVSECLAAKRPSRGDHSAHKGSGVAHDLAEYS